MSVRITEDFESGADGWSNPRTEDGGATFSNFLGRFGFAESGTIATQKTFDTSGSSGDISIEFDFYEFDDWDGDTFSVFIDGEQIFAEDFTDTTNDAAVTATVTTSIGVVTFTISPITAPADNAFATDLDQIHRVTITISEPTSDSFTLGFGGTFTASGEDFGIDNLTIERGAPADDDAVTVLESETTGDTDLNVLDNDLFETPTVVEVNGSTANVATTVDGSDGGTFTIAANGDVDFSADGDFNDLRKGQSATTTASYGIEVQGAGGKFDLILMQDLSGSFSNDLPNVQSEFGAIFDTLSTRGDDVGYGVASFVDKPTAPFGAGGDFAYRTDQAVSTDEATTQATLDGLSTLSGADLPESQLIGLQQIALRADTAEIGFREGAERIVVLQTDAVFHAAGDFTGVAADDGDTDVNETEDYPTVASVATLLQAAGIRVIFAVTADQIATYETLLDDLGIEGSVVELTSTSSNLSSAVVGALDTFTTVETATVTVTVEGFDDEDGDGIDDLVDIDDDNDGILDINEGGINTQVDSGIDGALGINDGVNDNTGVNVSFQITSANPDSTTEAHVLDSITIDGVVYSDFILPDDYQASAPDGSQALPTGATVRLVENSAIQETILDPNYEDIILADAFQNTNLNAYQELNGGDFSNAAYTLSYDEPILISAGGFIAITERGGNNSTTVTALDEFGNVLGTVTADQNVDYIQAQAQLNGSQDAEIAIYALDDLGDVGRKISQLVVTFPDPVADQPDGKIFIFGDIDALRERDSDGDGIVDRLDIDSDNDGITDNVEAQTTQGYTELTGNDSDGDGLDDAYDADGSSDAILSAGLDPVDTDLDGTDDFIDTDSDDDGTSDTDEAGHGVSQADIDASGDADGDGLKDAVEGSDANDGFDVNDENLDATDTNFLLADSDNDTAADGSNAAPTDVDLDYRDDAAAPDAVDDTATVNEDTAVIVSVLTNDSDLDGDTLSISSFGQGADGTVTDNGDGTLTYTPDENFNGSDSFTYTVSDGTGGTDTATVNVTVDPVNDAPDAIDDAASTDEETAVVISVLTNDVDVDGDTLSVLGVSQGANGSTVRNGDGTVTYTPDEGFDGSDTFNYIVSDGNGGTDMATVTVTVDPVNDNPVAEDDTATLDEDTAVIVSVLTNDSDADGDPLSISAFGQGANGTVTDNGDGTLTYTPDENFNGSDSFTYTVSDGNGGTDTATVNVTVDPVNDNPVAEDDTASTDADTDVIVSVLTNDTDVDGDTLSVLGVSQGTNGSTVRNGDGTVTYTPNAGFTGSDSFTYILSDGNGGTDLGTVNVSVNSTNTAPTAVDDDFLTVGGQSAILDLIANDTDPDGDPLTISALGAAGNGTVIDNGDGTVTYTPNAGFFSTDSFTYTVSDGSGGFDTATVDITQNFAPIIPEPVVLRPNENQTDAGRVAAFDFERDPITFSIAGGADAALFTINENTGDLSFINAPDFENPLAQDQTINGGNTYFVDVTASDPFASFTSTIEVVVQDIDENPNVAPTITNRTSPFGDPDAAAVLLLETSIGVVVDIDADDDPTDTLEFRIFGEDVDKFSIDEDTGEITLLDFQTEPDASFDNDAIFELDVVVTDQDGATDQLAIEFVLFLSA